MKLKCPICATPTDSETGADFPFCSERCRVLDLGNWASGKYVISSPAFDEDFDEVPETEPEDISAADHDGESKQTGELLNDAEDESA
jgi:uncharacterized protein